MSDVYSSLLATMVISKYIWLNNELTQFNCFEEKTVYSVIYALVHWLY
jgi:hypothetical protein